MAEMLLIRISKKKILDAVGLTYPTIFSELISQGLIKSYEEVVEVIFDKSKSLHVQSVLEFYDASGAVLDAVKKEKR